MNNLAFQYLKSPSEIDVLKLLRVFKSNKMYNTSILCGKYFIKKYPHNVLIRLELAMCAFYAKNYELSYNTYQNVLSFKNLPEKLALESIRNANFSIKHIYNKYIFYPEEKVKNINKVNNPIPLITFTITTCKRFDLFEKTINSFINCCKDIHKIDKWLCVDDNSSESDRDKMKTLYPFFTFYFKTPDEKGHPQSMNIIKRSVVTPYMFHMEDDWKFFHKRNYMSDCMDVLQSDLIKQCLINKNYGETQDDINIAGGHFNKTAKGLRYYIHEYCPNNELKKKFVEKYGTNTKNCAYWPHFSFRPSLIKREVFEKLGDFNEKISHFEMDYSNRYIQKTFFSAFLEDIYCIHIGRLTSQRHNTNIPNAYELNGEAQFSGKEKSNNTDNIKSINIIKPKKLNINIKTYIVNLDRRADRMIKFSKIAENSLYDYNRFSAIDGKLLKSTKQLQQIFEGNDYNMRTGMVGCALSHIKMCIELINSNYDMYCILEDDVLFTPNFQQKLIHLYNNNEGCEWDMIYLGHHLRKQFVNDTTDSKTAMPVLEKWDRVMSLTKSKGGTFGYLITKNGARKLLDYINTHGMTNGIDTVQQKAANVLNVYYCHPRLVYSECYTGVGGVDTDIQKDFKSLSMNIDERFGKEVSYYKALHDLDDEEEGEEEGEELGYTIESFIEEAKIGESGYYQHDNPKKLLDLEKSLTVPCYKVGDYLIVVPKPNEKQLSEVYFDRLKKNGEYNIDDVFKYKKNKQFKYTNTWFCRNIDISMKLMKTMFSGKNIDILEIGSHEGRSTVWMMENLCNEKSTFTSIDPYIIDDSSTNVTLETYSSFQHNTSICKNSNILKHYLDSSNNILPKLESDSKKYDLIYINSVTEISQVFFNLTHSHNLIKQNGVILLDDVGFDNNKTSGVMRAIKNFLNTHNSYKIILQEYQCALQSV